MIHRAPRCRHGFYANFCRAPGCPHEERRVPSDPATPPKTMLRRCDRCDQERGDVKQNGTGKHCDECREELRAYHEQRGQGGYSGRPAAVRRERRSA